MEAVGSPAGASAPSADAATPSPVAAPQPLLQADRKRGRAAWAAEQHAANQGYKQAHMEDEDGLVDICVEDESQCVLCEGVFVDLRQEAATVYGTLLHALKDEIDFANGYQFTYVDSRDNKRKLNTAPAARGTAPARTRCVAARM